MYHHCVFYPKQCLIVHLLKQLETVICVSTMLFITRYLTTLLLVFVIFASHMTPSLESHGNRYTFIWVSTLLDGIPVWLPVASYQL